MRAIPLWQKPVAWLMLKRMVGKFAFEEMWNLRHARAVKPMLGNTKLFMVGGNRRVEQMEQLIASGDADAVSMCRPFIREPYLVKRIREGKTTRAACTSCNRCVGAVVNDLPLRCYADGLPPKK